MARFLGIILLVGAVLFAVVGWNVDEARTSASFVEASERHGKDLVGLWWLGSAVCAVGGIVLFLRLRIASRHPLAKRPDNSTDQLDHATPPEHP